MTDRNPPVLRPEHPQARALTGLIAEFGLASQGTLEGVEISGVTLSTGDLQPGDLYVGLRGANSHGASYAAAARDVTDYVIAGNRRAALGQRRKQAAARAGVAILTVETADLQGVRGLCLLRAMRSRWGN